MMAELTGGIDCPHAKESDVNHSHQTKQDSCTTTTTNQSKESGNSNHGSAADPNGVCESSKSGTGSQPGGGESKGTEDVSKLKGVGRECKDVVGEPKSNTQSVNQRKGRGYWNRSHQEHGKESIYRQQRYPANRGAREHDGYRNNHRREQHSRTKYRDNHSTEVPGQVDRGQRSEFKDGVKGEQYSSKGDGTEGLPPTDKAPRGQRSEFKVGVKDGQYSSRGNGTERLPPTDKVPRGQRSELKGGVKDGQYSSRGDGTDRLPPVDKVHRGQRSEFKGGVKDVQHTDTPLPTNDVTKGDGKGVDVGSDIGGKAHTHPQGRELGTESKKFNKKPRNFDYSRQPNRKSKEERSPRQPRRAKDGRESKTRTYQTQSSTSRGSDLVPRLHPQDVIESSEERIAKEQIDKNGDSTTTIGKEITSKPREQEAHDSKEPLVLLSHAQPDVTSETSTGYKDVESYSCTRPAAGNNEQSHLNKKPRNRPKGRKTAVSTVQSDQLAQELTAGTYECMVCCDRVKGRDQVWSCDSCYHVFHLCCIRKWATAPRLTIFDDEEGDGWKCPSCRNVSTVVPTVYKCFCGRMVNPRQVKRDLTVPHTCGDLCLRRLALSPDSNCKHKCRLPCHPGPCPPCPVMVTRTCPCGKQPHQVRCSRAGDLPSCGAVCGRSLACARHSCEDVCHSGSCRPCTVMLSQQCYCRRVTRDVHCGEEDEWSFSCEQVCNRELNCGNHMCEMPCHDGPCLSCSLLPSAVTTCPCDATPLSELLSEENERMSCLDPVPTCEHVCGKRLACSIADNSHLCPSVCHIGECPPCDKTSTIQCVCGQSRTSVSCVDVVSGIGAEFHCKRVCNKKKSCGRHRCSTRCCVGIDHQCELSCGKKLRCGQHNCQENCHSGHCQQCWEYSYHELTCHCGMEILYPPIPCGTLPPSCDHACARMHPCAHPVNHGCHSEDTCPPCTFLVQRLCVGEHEVRSNIPCHINDVLCGSPCAKPLPCGMHKCQRTCHQGDCLEGSGRCRQPCTNKRRVCSHECGEPCHVEKPCPDTPCRTMIELKCECGRRNEKVMCLASESTAMQQAFQMFSKDIVSSGESVKISHMTLSNCTKRRELDCDETCKQMKRNKELAQALNIENPNLSPSEFGAPGEGAQFSQFLMEEARTDLGFVASVEEHLRTLVEAALKGSTNSTHNHPFRPMRSNRRQIIHELCVHYGCETASYDEEPMRNVTAYAHKSRAKLPSLTLSKVVERERSRPTPAPVHIMAVSGRRDEVEGLKKLSVLNSGQQTEPVTVPDYFADDLQL